MREETKSRTIVYTDKQFTSALEVIEASQLRVVDTETTGLDFTKDFIAGVCAHVLSQSYYFPFRHFEGKNLNEDYLQLLGDTLHSSRNRYGKPTQIVGFNYQYDAKMWLADGVEFPEVWDDPILMAHLANENEPSFKMERLAKRYIDPNADKEENELIAEIRLRFPDAPKGKEKGLLCYMDPEIVGPYGMRDVETTLELYAFYAWYLRKQKLWQLYKRGSDMKGDTGQRPYAKLITGMEVNGLMLDRERMEVNSEGSVKEAERLKSVLSEMAGKPVNPNSPKQMIMLLRKQNPTLILKSTKKDHLEIAPFEPNPNIKGATELLNYRKYSKAESTYYGPFREMLTPENSLHPNIRLVGSWDQSDRKGGTVSGRPSCQKPNLLAVTRGHGEAYSVRDVFIPREGRRFVEADLSQAELRVATHYANVPQMREAFKSGKDIHQVTADDLGIPRQIAKNVNFSFLYGIGAESFSIKYHLSRADSAKYLKAYDKKYPGFRKCLHQAEAFAEKHGYIKMFTGRKRHFNTSGALEKDAFNNLIQGSVSEMLRIAMLRIREAFTEDELLLVLTVYDSVLMEPIDDEDWITRKMIPTIRDIMEDQPWCSVPIKADFKTGYRWGDLKEVA